MLDCLILGDSIAVGVGQARPGCETIARVGIGSGAYLQTLFPGAPRSAQSVVISLGVNDDPAAGTLANLRRLRGSLSAEQVTWLLPAIKDEVRRAIRLVAEEHRDRLVDTSGQVGPDHLHPTGRGYKLIAGWTEENGNRSGWGLGGATPAAGIVVSMPSQKPAPAGLYAPGLNVRRLPSVTYGVWPPAHATYAAIPPSSYAFRAFPQASTTTR